MATWPALAELKQLLDIGVTDAWDGDDDESRLTRILASGIEQVKMDVGFWGDAQEPTPSQAQAALRLAELIATRPTAGIDGLRHDPTYRALMKHQRRVFGIA